MDFILKLKPADVSIFGNQFLKLINCWAGNNGADYYCHLMTTGYYSKIHKSNLRVVILNCTDESEVFIEAVYPISKIDEAISYMNSLVAIQNA